MTKPNNNRETKQGDVHLTVHNAKAGVAAFKRATVQRRGRRGGRLARKDQARKYNLPKPAKSPETPVVTREPKSRVAHQLESPLALALLKAGFHQRNR